MMMDAADLHVWLDTQPNAAQTVVIPYVKSARDMRLDYRMSVIQRSKSGSSQVSQGGSVQADANTPTSLSRVAVSAHKDAECKIELYLREGAVEIGNYRFECPR